MLAVVQDLRQTLPLLVDLALEVGLQVLHNVYLVARSKLTRSSSWLTRWHRVTLRRLCDVSHHLHAVAWLSTQADRVLLLDGAHGLADLGQDLAVIDLHDLQQLLDIEQAQIVLGEMNREQRLALPHSLLANSDQHAAETHAREV